jgi:hypothetical protein
MLGDDLRNWFELFDGLVVYRPQPSGGHVSDGWINWSDIENRFTSQKLRFAGAPYDPKNEPQRNRLLDAIVSYGSGFVWCKLLERRRQVSPPSLDYRLTPLGRRVSNWGYGPSPGFKKRTFFLLLALGLKAYKLRKVVAIGALGWAALNAVKFYTVATVWVGSLPFAAWSAAAIAAIVAGWLVIKAKVGGSE